MEDPSLDTYRNFAEISNDSAEDYGVNDEDSSPDGDVNNDNVINHNDAIADIINGDEDDHDFEDVSGNQPAIVLEMDCPAHVVFLHCDESTDPSVIGEATATSNCSVDGITIAFDDIATDFGDCSNTRTFVRAWTATDLCGGIGTCEQVITIVDETAPTLSCAPDIRLVVVVL